VLLIVGSGASLDSLKAARVIPVSDGIEIGRRPAGTGPTSLTLADRTVSSVHAWIMKGTEKEDRFEIQDMNSTNGTFVDGRRIERNAPLRDGSLLFIGAQVLLFRMVSAAELAALREDAATPFAPVPTLSPALAAVCSKLRRLARSEGEIFLLGETGVGKEVFARAIHQASGRAGKLMAINCAAIPRELLESELFGYEKGAHSTAQTKKGGLIEAADGGTLFLDELGEMPSEMQSKLLRFLQDRQYTPLGSTRSFKADVRVIAATSRVTVADGAPKAGAKPGGKQTPTVQEALVGRLGAQPVLLPPLRDRLEDLGRLAAFFLGEDSGRHFETEAFHALFLHSWPHNVRELQKVIAEAEILSRDSPTIGLEHLPDAILATVEADSRAAEGGEGDGETADASAANAVREFSERIPSVTVMRTRRPAPTAEELTQLLREYQGSVAGVARHLNRQYAVVWRCLQRYGINADEFRQPHSPHES
jgi:transcriptional regulator with PAS, ATPase and Fis domain